MPVHYPEAGLQTAVFEGPCAPEEADALLEWLRRTPDPCADLSGCADLHTAVAQLLLVANVRIVVPPVDPILAGCLGAGVAAATPATSPPASEGPPKHEPRKRRTPRRGVAASLTDKGRR